MTRRLLLDSPLPLALFLFPFALPLALPLPLAGCSRSGTASGAESSASSGAATTATAAAPATVNTAGCTPSALGLGTAAYAQIYRVPIGCALQGSGGEPTTIRSEDAFHAALNCKLPSGIDFTKNDLVAIARVLPPAGMGTDIVDDGKKVTFISKQRKPCPNEPPPMPITVTQAFLLPAGSARTYGDAVCAVDTPCR